VAEGTTRAIDAYLVRTAVLLKAGDQGEAAARFAAYRDWLKELATRGHRGARFLHAWGPVLKGLSGPRPVGGEGQLEVATGETRFAVDAAVEVVAEDEDLAHARFGHLVAWLSALKERGHPALAHVAAPPLAEPSGLDFGQRVGFSPEVADLLYPHADAWFDRDDIGAFGRRDVDAVFAWDAREALTLRTDEELEAVRALEQAALLLPQVAADPYAWKWVVLALHNALQGFMVLALQGTWAVRVMKRADRRAILAAHARGALEAALRQGDLEYFEELYDQIKKEKHMRLNTFSKAFRPGPTQTESVKRLNALRNDLVHFVPKTFVDAIEDLPLVVADCAEIIGFLAFESGNVRWTAHPELQARTTDLLGRVREVAAALSETYAAQAVPFLGKARAKKLVVRISNSDEPNAN